MSTIKNFLGNYSPTGPRMNRVSYLKYLIVFIVSVMVLAFAIGAVSILFIGNGAKTVVENFLVPVMQMLIGFMFISLGIRRNHDVGISGWWILISIIIPFYPLVFLFIPGTKGPNKFGPAPVK